MIINTSYKWFLLFALSLMMFIINVDYTAVNLTLIPMAREFSADLNTIQWVLSGYVLSWALLVIPAGQYIDKYKKNTLCLVGLSLFLIASLLAGIATSSSFLITSRVLQGVAGAIYAPTIYALIYINFDERDRGLAIGLMSLGIGLGAAIGPVIGGFLLSYFSWRSIFLINIPIGLIAFIIIFRNRTYEKINDVSFKISKKSVLLLGISCYFALYALSKSRDWYQSPGFYCVLFGTAAVAFTLFILLQRKLSNPLVPLTLFKNLSFSGCIFGIICEQFGFATIMVSSGLYLQKILQFSALKSCLVYLALTIVFGIIAVVGGIWVDKVGLKKPTVIGLFIMAVGSFLFVMMPSEGDLLMLCLVFLVLGIGMGLAFSGLNTGIVKTVSQDTIGIASSIFLMAALLGNSFGVMITTLIYEHTSHIKFLKILSARAITLSEQQIHQLAEYIANIGQSGANLTGFNDMLRTTVLQETASVLNNGINNAMLFNSVLLLVATVCCFKLLKTNISKTVVVEQQE
jgi:EmrB/QacA subfamily drug resistance transporter